MIFSVPYTMKLFQHNRVIVLLSGFTYPNISNQDERLHEAGYQLIKLTHRVCFGCKRCLYSKGATGIWLITVMGEFTGSRATDVAKEEVWRKYQAEDDTVTADRSSSVSVCVKGNDLYGCLALKCCMNVWALQVLWSITLEKRNCLISFSNLEGNYEINCCHCFI